jgi:hypothetical protein
MSGVKRMLFDDANKELQLIAQQKELERAEFEYEEYMELPYREQERQWAAMDAELERWDGYPLELVGNRSLEEW